MRNISLGAAKKNVDSSGLEGALMKAKGDAAQLKAELMELKKSGATKADSSSSGSSKGGAKGADAGGASAAALAEVQKRLLAKEEQVEAIKDENALLRSQLAAAERKANDLAASALANAEVAPPPPKPAAQVPPSPTTPEGEVVYKVGDRVMVRDAGEAWEWGTVETIEFDEPLVRKDGWDEGDSYFWKETRYPTAAELAADSDHSDESSDSDKGGRREGGGGGESSDESDDSDDSESEKKIAAPAPRRRPSGVSGVASSGGGRGGAAKPGAAANARQGRGKPAPVNSKSPVRSMKRS